MKIVFIADFFVDQILGGGELNNEELLKILRTQGHHIKRLNSHLATPDFIEENKNSKFIIANFVNLQPTSLQALYNKQYVIYEHDHKYLTTRDPSKFKDFLAPKEAIINYEFYKEANAVFCQSQFHLDIIYKNLKLDNLINLGGNLWSEKSLDLMTSLALSPKSESCAIMHSSIEHKNTREAVMYCEYKKIPFKLIGSDNYEIFLKQMSDNDTFVFFPKTPETLSRVIVEARMMGLSIITNKSVGATREEWYQLKGIDLIKKVRKMRETIPQAVLEVFAK
jgi:hypothetical protein